MLADFEEDLNSVPSTHIERLTAIQFQGIRCLLTSESVYMHVCMHKDAYTEIKIILNEGYCTCAKGGREKFLVKMTTKTQNGKN